MIGVRLRGFGVIALATIGLLSITAGRAGADVVVAINKSAQRMSVLVDGVEKHAWAVSTGLGGGPPTGSYRPQRLERSWYSRKYHHAPMPYSIFFHENYAVHGTVHVRQLGRRASKGCVRLHPANAAILFELVRSRGTANTRIVISNAAYVAAPAAARASGRSASPRIDPQGQAPDAAKELGTIGKGRDAEGHAERGDAPPALRTSIDQAAIVPAAGAPASSPVADSDNASPAPDAAAAAEPNVLPIEE